MGLSCDNRRTDVTGRPLVWVGVDVGKAPHHACAMDAAGKVVFSRKVANDQAVAAEGASPHKTWLGCAGHLSQRLPRLPSLGQHITGHEIHGGPATGRPETD